MSEAGSGSDAFALKTRAVDKGDHYELTGQKLWITNGNEAEIFVLFATVDPEAGYKGITAFIVEKGFEGFSVGKKEDKLGIRASSTTELILDNCKVPKENVLGEVGKGYKVSIETLNEGRIGIGAQMLGIAQGAYEAALKYTRNASSSASRSTAFRPCSSSLRKWPSRSRRHACSFTTPRGSKTRARLFLKEAAMAKLYSSRCAESVHQKRSSFTAATATSKIIRSKNSGAIQRSARSTKAPRTCSCRRSRS